MNSNRTSEMLRSISICFVLFAIVNVVSAVPRYTSGKLCLTETCITTAADLLNSINKTVDPCEDYMQYACGSWSQNNYAPPWRSSFYGTFYWLRDDVFFKKQGLMKETVMRNDVKAIRKMKYVYQACINEKLINKRKGEPLLKMLKSLGGWPVLGGAQEQESVENFNYIDTMAKMSTMGFNLLLYRGVYSGYKDKSKYYLQFDQAPLLFPRKYLVQDHNDFVYYYREFARKMAQELGATASDYEQQMNDVIDFEIALAKLNVPDKGRDWDASYRRYTLSSFKSQVTDKIDLERLINAQLRTVNKPNFKSSQEFIVWSKPKFFVEFAKLIEKTPKKTLKNYMLFNVVYYTAGYLDTESYGYIYNDFVESVWGKEDRSHSRSSICTKYTDDAMGWALGRAFVDRYFDKGAKKIAESLVEDIRTVFIGLFGKVSWMDHASQQTAIEKAKAIEKNVGYPLEISDDRKLNKMYEKFEVSRLTYFENVVMGWGSMFQESLMKLGEKVDMSKWDVVPTVVNAFYQPSRNKISVPAAILQPPFYSKNYPEYLNYGGIGAVLGHELTHGFDSTGKNYDLHGNYRKWWPTDVLEKYKERANCFVHQYNTFYIPELQTFVNGKNTLDENIADNGGVLESFKAYRDYIKRRGSEEDSLPGLNMNNNELFFLNLAQTFCTEIFTREAWTYFQEEVHAPDRYRVWGSMINSKDFSNTYNCKVRSKMNPEKKCKMWE